MGSSEDEEVYWRANSPDQFCWGIWQDEEDAVLFHQGSGDTLMLNPLGEYLLRQLQSDDQTQPQLVTGAAKFFELDSNNELTDAVAVSMHTFQLLGLVMSGQR
jgi:PqqD family protein of HPr-rel-A system